ncbi:MULTISPECIES: hypothetical protein [Brevibacillus]|jgi:hypothetical protein|uniref:Uncharacterized protein n=1 Tax=Brevibacillus parabrevis TaxID=54914 RepID=A0A4Y3PN70_BREPA|nr:MULTISPECIES: hypothetical protein [Brevibacillus]MDR4998103.1 hypothetical protein [Brevibacillus parabrevis]MED1726246.1 hypothetical protein [Brevibacillus parabrevis]GEB33436.1 hypothetical protein BPA01_30160 [Brevibacillus parabrevis]
MKRFFVLLAVIVSIGLFSNVAQASKESESLSISTISSSTIIQYHHGVGG